jgi:hypothetical protein
MPDKSCPDEAGERFGIGFASIDMASQSRSVDDTLNESFAEPSWGVRA